MTGTFDAKRSDGITDALPGYLFEQRTQICRADVGMSCDIIQARPMLPQTMEFITDMGTIFQSCMKDEISVDEFCEKAQGLVEKYSK